MKKLFLFAMLLILSASSFGQQTKPSPDLTKQDYLQKSKKQKKTAMIFLSGGAGLIATALIIPKGELVHEGIYCGPGAGILCNEEYKNDGIKAAFGLAGAASMLGSIPLFIASGKNKRRANAISASLKTDNASIVRGYSLTRINYPALSLKIALN